MGHCALPASRTVSSRHTSSDAHVAPGNARAHAHDPGKPWPSGSSTQALIPVVSSPWSAAPLVQAPQLTLTHSSTLEVEGEMKRSRGRHKVLLLNLVSCSCSPLYRHSQSMNVQGMAIVKCSLYYYLLLLQLLLPCCHIVTCNHYYMLQPSAAQVKRPGMASTGAGAPTTVQAWWQARARIII